MVVAFCVPFSFLDLYLELFAKGAYCTGCGSTYGGGMAWACNRPFLALPSSAHLRQKKEKVSYTW